MVVLHEKANNKSHNIYLLLKYTKTKYHKRYYNSVDCKTDSIKDVFVIRHINFLSVSAHIISAVSNPWH